MELTRRPSPHRSDCWHIHHDDVQVGTIAKRSGVPFDAPQWEWKCGFYPASHRGIAKEGIASDFEQARADFEAAWHAMQPQIDESDCQEHRLQRARTAWKYAMHNAGAKLPTEMASGRSKCFCGAEINVESVSFVRDARNAKWP